MKPKAPGARLHWLKRPSNATTRSPITGFTFFARLLDLTDLSRLSINLASFFALSCFTIVECKCMYAYIPNSRGPTILHFHIGIQLCIWHVQFSYQLLSTYLRQDLLKTMLLYHIFWKSEKWILLYICTCRLGIIFWQISDSSKNDFVASNQYSIY